MLKEELWQRNILAQQKKAVTFLGLSLFVPYVTVFVTESSPLALRHPPRGQPRIIRLMQVRPRPLLCCTALR